jgi:hypothetical protein
MTSTDKSIKACNDFLAKNCLPIQIQEFCQSREEGLAYGLDFHLQTLNTKLTKGAPNDKRFPERDHVSCLLPCLQVLARSPHALCGFCLFFRF